jgi:hypothetical protein
VKIGEPGLGFGPLLHAIRQHYTANDLIAPQDLEARVEEFTCQRVPERCKYSDGTPPALSAHEISFAQVKQGASTLYNWYFKQGGKRASQQLANSRALTCSQCNFNKPVSGCAGCAKGRLMEIVNKIAQGGSTPSDSKLGGCTVCGCSLQAKVWIPIESIQPYITAPQWENFTKATNNNGNPLKCWVLEEKLNQSKK